MLQPVSVHWYCDNCKKETIQRINDFPPYYCTHCNQDRTTRVIQRKVFECCNEIIGLININRSKVRKEEIPYAGGET